jgi:hypothetical protein
MTSSPAGGVRDRETIIQKKTGRPVRFEITEQTRNAVGEAARRSRPAERPVPADEKSGLHSCFAAPDATARCACSADILRPNPTAQTHHLQIIQHDHPSFRALIMFRKVLRRDVKARAAYSALKVDLASKHQTDRSAYSNAKTEFVQAILEAEGVSPSSRKSV